METWKIPYHENGYFLMLDGKYIKGVVGLFGSGGIVYSEEKPKENFSSKQEAQSFIDAFLRGRDDVEIVQ